MIKMVNRILCVFFFYHTLKKMILMSKWRYWHIMHLPSQLSVTLLSCTFLYLCFSLPRGPVLVQCLGSAQTLSNLVWRTAGLNENHSPEQGKALSEKWSWGRQGQREGKDGGISQGEKPRHGEKWKCELQCLPWPLPLPPAPGCAMGDAPRVCLLGSHSPQPHPLRKQGPSLAHLPCSLFTLQNWARLGFPGAIPPTITISLRKLFLWWLRKGVIKHWITTAPSCPTP